MIVDFAYRTGLPTFQYCLQRLL